MELSEAKNVHTVASLLKFYFAELPESVLTFELIDCFLMAVGMFLCSQPPYLGISHGEGMEQMWWLSRTLTCMDYGVVCACFRLGTALF